MEPEIIDHELFSLDVNSENRSTSSKRAFADIGADSESSSEV